MDKRAIVFTLCIFFVAKLHGQWAQVFRKEINRSELSEAEKINVFEFTKCNVPLYSQLLFSWNAIRPAKGHLNFFIKAHNAHTGKWGLWHRMIEWGNDAQRSFSSKSDGFTKYVHVRLETEPLQLANGFRIRVVGAKGATLSALKNITATTINMREFQPEVAGKITNKLSSVLIENVPKISQLSLDHPEKNRICSPTSCMMLSQHITQRKDDPVAFAQASFDTGLNSYGSWPFNMANLFERAEGKIRCYNTRLNSFCDIHRQLKKNLPVVVSIRGQLNRAPRAYPHGHLLTVVGYDARTKEVICHDPAKAGHGNVEQRYELADFMRSWEASRRLSYLVERM